MYSVTITREANSDLARLKKSEPRAYKKAVQLIEELYTNPTMGLGKPEILKYGYNGLYSRQITQRHKLIYRVNDDTVIVLVISAYGHYNDK